MTIRELALNLIEHAGETPTAIDLDRATELIGWMDPDTGLPEDLTPEAFMEAWNDIIASAPPEDLWSDLWHDEKDNKIYDKVLREGIVDTNQYRYIVKECRDAERQWLEIRRLPIRCLDTTDAIDGWKTVKVFD